MLTCRLPYKIYNRCSQFFRLEFCSNIIFYQYLSHFTNKILYLFLSFSFHFCPSSVTLLSQKKKKPQGCVLVGVTSTGLEISEVISKSCPITSFMPCVSYWTHKSYSTYKFSPAFSICKNQYYSTWGRIEIHVGSI